VPAVAAEPAAAPASSAPPPARAEPPTDAGLPVGKIIGSVVVGRLRDPRAVAVLAVVALLAGIAIGRKRS
jgi:hypothetical protein